MNNWLGYSATWPLELTVPPAAGVTPQQLSNPGLPPPHISAPDLRVHLPYSKTQASMMLLIYMLMKTEDQLFGFSQEANAEMTTLILGRAQQGQNQLPILNFFFKRVFLPCFPILGHHELLLMHRLVTCCFMPSLGIGFTYYRKE